MALGILWACTAAALRLGVLPHPFLFCKISNLAACLVPGTVCALTLRCNLAGYCCNGSWNTLGLRACTAAALRLGVLPHPFLFCKISNLAACLVPGTVCALTLRCNLAGYCCNGSWNTLGLRAYTATALRLGVGCHTPCALQGMRPCQMPFGCLVWSTEPSPFTQVWAVDITGYCCTDPWSILWPARPTLYSCYAAWGSAGTAGALGVLTLELATDVDRMATGHHGHGSVLAGPCL